MANQKIYKAFTATGNSAANVVYGNFNVSVQFANASQTGTIHLERSYDGTTFEVTDKLSSNTSAVALEPERGVTYQFSCQSISGGTITARIGGHGER